MSNAPHASERGEVDRATAMLRSLQELVSQPDSPAAWQPLVDGVAALLGARWAEVWLLDDEGTAVAPAARFPRATATATVFHGKGQPRDVVSRAAISGQLEVDEEDLAIPVLRRQDLLAVLAVGAHPDEEGRVLISLLAAQAAVLLENARLRENEREVRQEKDEFVSIVSHEFKTPLTAIKGFSQLVARRLGERADEPTLKYLQTIDQQATRLARFATDMVTYSRLEAGKLQMARFPVDLVALVRGSVDGTRLSVDRHNLCIQAEEESLAVVGDADRLQGVVNTLLGNAIKYSPDGGEVRLDVRRKGNAAVISVHDQGIGMSEEQCQSLFRRFYRSDQAMAMGEGTGLSLAIAKGIVEAHGGRMWVSSEPERGSTFYISLPLAN